MHGPDHKAATDEYIENLSNIFLDYGDIMVAEGKAAYMKYQFDFYGLRAETWVRLQKEFIKRYGYPVNNQLSYFVEICFKSSYRELHYAAIQVVEKVLHLQDSKFIDTLEFMILTNSWWDSVDWIAKLVGIHFKRFPSLLHQKTGLWNKSDNIWLVRVSIIFQLFYKETTDFNLLKTYVLNHQESKEFFIRKAQGWALRQYSKTNPRAVSDFVQEHPNLSGLTKREALRLIKKHGW